MGTPGVVERTFQDHVELNGNREGTKCLYLWGNDEVDAGRVLSVVESQRWSELAQIEGFFAGAYNSDAGTYLFSDRLGVYPLFYLIADSRIYAAPLVGSIQRAAGVNPPPCTEGIVSLLLFGHHLADETIRAGIRRCSGGRTVVIAPDGRVSETLVWSGGHTYRTEPSITPNELAELFVSNVRQETSSSQRVILALSGGFDSRTVLGALLECMDASEICAMTFGGPDTSDFKIGQLVAQRAGVRSVCFPISNEYFDDQFLRQRGSDYSYTYSVFASQPADMIAALSKEEVSHDLSLWGVGGDAISGSHLHDGDDQLPPCRDDVSRAQLLINGRAYIPLDLVSQTTGVDSGEVVRIVSQLLQNSPAAEYDESWQFLDAWDILVRGRMELIGVLPFGSRSWRCPHLSGEYFREMSALCFSQKLHQAAYRQMLTQRFEALFSLPSKRLRGRSLVAPKNLADRGFALQAARAGSLLRRALNLDCDSVDRNYAKDQDFFKRARGRERVRHAVAVLSEHGILVISPERATLLAQDSVQLARMLITLAYAFEADEDVANMHPAMRPSPARAD